MTRHFIKPDQKEAAKSALDQFTGGTIPGEKLDQTVNRIIDQINFHDAMKFLNIDPSSNPIVLTPDQYGIVKKQLDQLPRDSDDVRNAVQKGIDDGRIQVQAPPSK